MRYIKISLIQVYIKKWQAVYSIDSSISGDFCYVYIKKDLQNRYGRRPFVKFPIFASSSPDIGKESFLIFA